jgi:hypothetical protein
VVIGFYVKINNASSRRRGHYPSFCNIIVGNRCTLNRNPTLSTNLNDIESPHTMEEGSKSRDPLQEEMKEVEPPIPNKLEIRRSSMCIP